MAKVIAHAAGHDQPSSASWILLVVSVLVVTVLAISVPHLVGAEGWLAGDRAGEKFLYVALVAYLGASFLYAASTAVRQAGLLAGAVSLTRGGFLLHTTAILV